MTRTLDDFGGGDDDSESNDTRTEAEAAARHDAKRIVEKRARFLEASTQLDAAETRTLAWSEAGYSKSGIAKKVGSTEGTVAERLDRITARYGIAAVFAKQPEERGRMPLSPATPDEIAAFPRPTRLEWRELAEQYPEYAPEWVGTERDPTTEDWKRELKRRDRDAERGGDGR